MGSQRLRRTVLAGVLACAWSLASCGGSAGSGGPSTGTQTGDEGDVSTPGAACVPACGSTLTCCVRRCVDANADLHNCGRCGNACARGEACVNGVCTAPPAN